MILEGRTPIMAMSLMCVDAAIAVEGNEMDVVGKMSVN